MLVSKPDRSEDVKASSEEILRKPETNHCAHEDNNKETKSHGDLEDEFKTLKSKHEMVKDLKSKTMIAKQKAKIAKLKAERAVLKSNL